MHCARMFRTERSRGGFGIVISHIRSRLYSCVPDESNEDQCLYIYPLIDGRQLIWADCDTCCCYCTHIFVADMSQAKLHLLPGSGILWSGCNVTEKNYVDPASMHCVSVFATWMFKWIWRDAWWSHESPTHDAVTRPHGAWVRTTRSARIFLNVHVAAIGSLYMRRCAVHTGSTEFFFQCNRTKTCPPIRGSVCRRAPPFSTN